MLTLIKLPFKEELWEPVVSATTLFFHHKRHHQAYVDKTNELITGTTFENLSLEDIIKKTYQKPEYQTLYNNAGQVYNHNIYWQSYDFWNKLNKSTQNEILRQFGSKKALKTQLTDSAVNLFGSGWVWLIKKENEEYDIITTKNGDTPLHLTDNILFNIDVWEHAYYLDYQNLRKKYVDEFTTHILKI